MIFIKVKSIKKEQLDDKSFMFKYILLLWTIFIFIIFMIFIVESSDEYLTSLLSFVKKLNIILSLAAFVCSLLIYKEIEDTLVFVLSLMYLSLFIGIVLGNIDYFLFYEGKFIMSNYISISPSLLRVFILFIAMNPNNKVHKYASENKALSYGFVTMWSIIFGILEYYIIIPKIISYKMSSIYVYYYIFLIVVYFIIAIRLLNVSVKKQNIIYIFFGLSIFTLGLKAIYSIYGFKSTNFDIRLSSISITYICFFIIIIATGVNQYIIIKKSKHLNNELLKFFNLVDNNKHSYMLICDENLKISYMNNKFKEIYSEKINNEVFKERLIKKYFTENQIKQIFEELKKYGYWGGTVTDSQKNTTLDYSIQVLNYNNWEDMEILISYTDISKYIRLENEIEIFKLNDIRKDEFISNLSHELKTPLNIIYSTIQLFDKIISNGEGNFKEIYYKYNNTLKLNCKRMLKLTSNIVDTSSIDLDKINANYGNYNIVKIVEDVTLSTTMYAKKKEISILFDTNLEEHYIKCDPIMIEKIVLNMISNAIKYSSINSNIYIDLMIEKRITRILFKDEGIGIPDNIKEKIFERFVRADKSFTRLNEGSGIGLNLVKSIVDIHNGKISVESAVGKGSIFEIQLPNEIIKGVPKINYEYEQYDTELQLSDIYM